MGFWRAYYGFRFMVGLLWMFTMDGLLWVYGWFTMGSRLVYHRFMVGLLWVYGWFSMFSDGSLWRSVYGWLTIGSWVVY